jgi:hypothetical protein
MSHQQKQQQFYGNDEDIRSMDGSEWSLEEEEEGENIIGHGNAKQKEESHSKIALLEVNNS